MSDTTEFCVFDLPVVYVYGGFPFDLDAIGIVLVHISSTSGSTQGKTAISGLPP